MRGMFGVGARAEILRCLLSRPGRTVSVARLATLTGYAKRNVAEECDTLERAGVLTVRPRANRFYYSLARRPELEAFVGALPSVRPPWTPLLTVARTLVELERRAEATPGRTLAVHVRRALRDLDGELDELDVEPVSDDVRGDDLWPAARRLGQEHLGAWAAGRWPGAQESG
jgi:DNA-binding transcriptional ArsR family regulator